MYFAFLTQEGSLDHNQWNEYSIFLPEFPVLMKRDTLNDEDKCTSNEELILLITAQIWKSIFLEQILWYY